MNSNIKVIPQTFQVATGITRSYSVIIDGVPRYTYNTEEEVESFLRGLDGN